ncbi:oxidoreductase [Cellvibrio zantedeschiae]|uniref:Oxidoreductase n=1 Tax=Cellvibrio zantedeschiae TaxID=1237077 RepID=A0ABQ3B7U0_9GAMM|nr:SDR family oxidoreductase [Cellvibrio zantedeschiae]GGY83413.1 oxidoreductase [Cellvibrio zantedeschiae]
MSYSLQGKSVLVTGANRGIGKALVQALIERGAKRIYAAGRNSEGLAAIVQLAPSIVEAVQLEVTRAEDIQQLAGKLKQLDVLINNAGIATGITFSAETSLSIASAEMAVNYFGPVHLTHALLPLLRASKGAVVNVSSIAGIANFPILGPYSASKAAVHSFTQGLRAELRGAGVFVQGVYPGPVDTDMTKDFEMDKASPADVARIVLNGLETGDEDIFPDAFSQAMYEVFKQNPKQLEQQFGQMLG